MHFIDLPSRYQLMITQIQNNIIQKLYSEFSYLYYPLDIKEKISNSDDNNQKEIQIQIKMFLFNYFKKYKFIIYRLSNFFKDNDNYTEKVNENLDDYSNCSSEICSVIICVEGKCIIINQIWIFLINEIINELKNQEISIINLSSHSGNEESKAEKEAKEEIKNYCNQFRFVIKNNKFVQKTITPMIGYLIRRYYFPSDYFKDKSFFNFLQSNKSKEREINDKINELLCINTKDDMKSNLKKFAEIDEMIKNSKNDQVIKNEFIENDFIYLRTLFCNENAVFHLAIHRTSFYIFMVKKMTTKGESSREFTREIEFCKNYTHRCMVPFYGFMKDKNKISGFVYEFMSNGSLDSKFRSIKENGCEIYSLMTINRIVQAIEYLHSNTLIHRDIKPLNILINHDNIPYVSDFETIRHTIESDEKTKEKEMTNDIGSTFYVSPEQCHGYLVSYPTDIYSFGLTIYFILEKKDLYAENRFIKKSNTEQEKIQLSTKVSKNIENIINSCIKTSPSERLTIKEIKQMIINEINSVFSLKKYDTYELIKSCNQDISRFIYEGIIIQHKNIDICQPFIFYFQLLFLPENKDNKNNSFILKNIGDLYIINDYVKKDCVKAKEYYELAAKLNNSNAIFNIAILYDNGEGVEKDFSKAKEYYELAGKLNNSNAYYYLGNHYAKGDNCEQDFIKAKKYYELAASLNNKSACLNLGTFYAEGEIFEQNFTLAHKYFQLAAQQNDAEALFNLGLLYDKGLGVKQDYDKALKYYELSANLNNQGALNNLGYIYKNGEGVKRDYAKAKEYFEKSAKQNNEIAFFNLGELYEDGTGVKQDYLKAKEYYELSAKQDYPPALYNLGNLYFYGFGVKKDYLKTKEYLERAANYGNSSALLNLGNLYANGLGVKQDYLIAMQYYEMAAQNNNPEAFLNLGIFYTNGLGVKQNYVKAREYYEIAANYEYPAAFLNLGFLYYHGYGVKRDIYKAKEYFEYSANLGDSNALLNLGILYRNGDVIKQDYMKANEYFRLAAQLGFSKALLCLGESYYSGLGVKKDISKTKEYYELACKYNDSDAFLLIGIMYLYGKAVPQNYGKAKEYFEKSAQQNNSKAFLNLGLLYYKGYGVEKDYTKAKKYYELAAYLNNFDANLLLGNLYYNGQGVQKDDKKAKEYYELAANQNNPYAFFSLGYLYENGFGVKQDYLKAKELYEVAANYNISQAMINLGNLYKKGNGVKRDQFKAKQFYEAAASLHNSYALISLGQLYTDGYSFPEDYPQARHYFELAAQQNNSNGYLELGNLYFNGSGVEQDYSKAIEYYELAAKQNNAGALLNLGRIYINGRSVKQDFTKARKYFEILAGQGNSDALFGLGIIYFKGEGVKQDYKKSLNYFKYAAELNNSYALFYLGCFYSNGNIYEVDIEKAIECFMKCIEIHHENFSIFTPKKEVFSIYSRDNLYLYYSYNNLALIYITVYEDIEKGLEFLKEAAFAELSFAQNNFGLLNQLYLNKEADAEYMYQKSSKNHFALAEYNLGQLCERKRKKEEAIKHYLKASELEDYAIIFHNHKYGDIRLDISKTFVICFTNLKLTEYYYSLENYKESKKFFSKSFAHIINDSYKFHFESKSEFTKEETKEIFSYLKKFIFCFPPFNFAKQQSSEINKIKTESKSLDISELVEDQHMNDEFEKKIKNNEAKEKIFREIENDEKNYYIKTDEYKRKPQEPSQVFRYLKEKDLADSDDKKIFDSPDDLFDFIIKNEEINISFPDEIKVIIDWMQNILYSPPYNILFGRINIEKPMQKMNVNILQKEINSKFYEGFGFEEFQQSH